MPTIERGTIKFWRPEKGFGFIRTSAGAEIFGHQVEVQEGRQPARGDKVEFVAGVDRNGRARALNIKIIQGNSMTRHSNAMVR